MMYQLTFQDVTYQDYPIQCFSSPSTGVKEIDTIDFWSSVSSNQIRRQLKGLFYPSLISVMEIDPSSIGLHFEIKAETFLTKESTEIPEEDIAMEMVEHDFVVKMLPQKRYKIQVHVRSVRKGEPRFVEPDDFLVIE